MNIYFLTHILKGFKIFCAFPISFNKNIKKYEKESFKWFYCICLLSITTILSGNVIFLIEQLKQANIREAVRLLFKIYQQVASFAIIATCYFIRGKLATTMNLYAETDDILNKAGANSSNKVLFFFLLTKHILAILCMLILNIICFAFQADSNECAFQCVGYLLNYEIASNISNGVCALLLFANQRIRILNHSATNMVLKGKFDQQNKYLKIAYNAEQPEATLRTITIVHFRIVKISNMINETYSFQILVILNFGLARIIESVHYLLNYNTETVPIIIDLFWSLMVIVEALTMCSIATLLATNTDETAKIVNMISSNENSLLQFEKDMFLLQCQHQRLSLEACGLYPLNNETYLSLCGTSITFIILIQGLSE